MSREIPKEKMDQMIEFLNAHKVQYGRTSGQQQLIEEEEIFTPLHEFIIYELPMAFQYRNVYQSYFNEILSWFDVFDKEEDPYTIFADTIERKFGSLKGRNIIEIGCGPVPALSRRLAERMRDNDGNIVGSITAYDPDIVIDPSELPGVTLKRALFDEDTKIPEDVILVSMTPITQVIHIIEFKVNSEKIASIVQLGIDEDEEIRFSLKSDHPYGIMTLSHEPSKYSKRDERVITYLGEDNGNNTDQNNRSK